MNKSALLPLGLVSLLLSAPAMAEEGTVPPAFQGYINTMSAPCEYRPLPKSLDAPSAAYLTPEQAREDVQMFRYLMDTAYSGREYWARHGVDFPGLYKALEERVHTATSDVPTADLKALIKSGLSGIQDGHLIIGGMRFFRHQDAYFSDVLLEKRGSEVVVLASKVNGLTAGTVYTGRAENLFPTFSPRDKSHYLLGQLTNRPNRMLRTSFAGQEREVPLHRCRIAEPKRGDDPVFSLTRSAGPRGGLFGLSAREAARL